MTTRYETYEPSLDLMKKVQELPEKPGVYQFFNGQGKIIYVGKAKNLKRRVSSYFQKNPANAKTALMVKSITEIQTVVVANESEALLLENSLIKRIQPRYNVLLKDDKTFPWICIKQEPFPRIFTTRNLVYDGSKYFGPYTSGRIWRSLVDLIRSLYKIRTCQLHLSQANIASGKFKVCLEYQIGNCLGPCVGLQSMEEYLAQIEQIEKILKGQTQEVLHSLKEKMQHLANEFEFERAAEVKQRIDTLRQFQAKSVVVNPSVKHVDVFTIISDEHSGYVNYLKVVDGALVQAHSVELRKKLDETDRQLLETAVVNLLDRIGNHAPEILLPMRISIPQENCRLVVPKRGDKKTLLDLSERNARYFKIECQKQKIRHSPGQRTERKLEALRKDLRMKVLPTHIECFDNSNIQGKEPVAACVVFRNATPSKKDYRHFNIRTVSGPDDYSSMAEVVFRRYKRMLDQSDPLPQLIVVDGGKGQLSSAVSSLELLGLRGEITIIGIAKRLEEIYFPEDPVPLYLDKNSESLRIIQKLRNEAHRFGINHHRARREKGLTRSELIDIDGVGDKTMQQLLEKFRSVKSIRAASIEDITVVVGLVKARKIYNHFHDQSHPSTSNHE